MHIEEAVHRIPTGGQKPAPVELDRPRQTAPSGTTSEVDAGTPVREADQSPSRARLSFDKDLKRVFVEVVDAKTGDVIERFPPEQLTKHMDELLKASDRSDESGVGSGVLLDQTV